MDYTGFLFGFRNNRPLTEEEVALRLKPKVRLDVPTHYQLAVIKMNSAFLDSVDRWFGYRGLALMIALIVMGLSGTVVVLMLGGVLSGAIVNKNGLWEVALTAASIFFLFFLAGVWLARSEAFAWTHYPIRLDRQKRLVHVFRRNGTVLSVPWDEVFFTLGRGRNMLGIQLWDVRGLVMDADGKTVRETFAFAAVSTQDNVRGHWEFLRRYMEDGPAGLVGQVEFCMPVDGKKESFHTGMERIFANDANGPKGLYILSAPFNFVHGLARWIAMQTSRIPAWPQEIVAATPVAAQDPYTRDASSNPGDLR